MSPRLSSVGLGALGCTLALVATASPEGDPQHGAQLYQQCMACHALGYNRTGPRHCGVLGRRAGSVPGYRYSDAMRRSGIVWTRATLDAFLAAPTRFVEGTTMTYAGIPGAQDRRDLIAFLEAASNEADLCTTTTGKEKP
jgi:cytochrome c